MSYFHPTHPARKMTPELLILLISAALLLLSVMVVNIIRQLPQERSVPAPVMAEEALPVHFSRLQGSASVTEASMRSLTGHATKTPVKDALQELLNGPSSSEKGEGFYSEIPQGTRLLGVNIENNIVHIDLSREFTSGGGSTSMIQRVKEIQDTVQDSARGPQQIMIAIEGKPLRVLGGEGLELD